LHLAARNVQTRRNGAEYALCLHHCPTILCMLLSIINVQFSHR